VDAADAAQLVEHRPAVDDEPLESRGEVVGGDRAERGGTLSDPGLNALLNNSDGWRQDRDLYDRDPEHISLPTAA
jgi:hypothetical protein